MAIYQRGQFLRYRFRFAGKQIDESTKTTSKTIAREAERQHRRALEAGYNNFKELRENRVRGLQEIIDEYLVGYRLRYRSATFAEYALGHVARLLGTKTVGDITDSTVLRYQEDRLREKAAPKSINEEVRFLLKMLGDPSRPHGICEVKLSKGRTVYEGKRLSLSEMRRMGRKEWRKRFACPTFFITGKDKGKLSYFWDHVFLRAKSGPNLGGVVNPDSGVAILDSEMAKLATYTRTRTASHAWISRVASTFSRRQLHGRDSPRERARQRRSHDRLVDAGLPAPDVLRELRTEGGEVERPNLPAASSRLESR